MSSSPNWPVRYVPTAAQWSAAFAAKADTSELVAGLASVSSSILSIVQSGAVGNGVTDDRAVIQAWLTGLPSGSRVTVPAGKYYYIGSTITVPPNVLIEGAGPPAQAAVFSNWGGAQGFILAAGATISMGAGAALRSLMIKRTGLLAAPTAAQCVAAVAAWGGETSIGVTVPADTGGVVLSDLMIVGFNTAVKSSSGQFAFSHLTIDCYNGVEVTTAGDNHYIDDVRCEPYYALATNGTLGGWARPGVAFHLHGGNTGGYISRCFSFMYGTSIKMNGVGITQISDHCCEWQPTLANGFTATKGVLATGANAAIMIATSFISSFETGYDIQGSGDYNITAGQVTSPGASGCIKIAGGAGCSGLVTGTYLYLFAPASAPAVVIGAGLAGTNERWKFDGISLQGITTAASWITIDASSISGVDLLNVRGTLYTASGYLGSQTTVQSRINEKLHVRTDPSVATVDGASNAPFTAESLESGVAASRVQNFWRSGTLIGSVKLMPSGGTQGAGMTIFGTDIGNGSVAIVPNGTGAIMAAIPNGLASGGNARGQNAVDWQVDRASASQVASGPYSVIVYGKNNTASGLKALAGGDGTSVSGDTAMAMGFGHSATGDRSAIFGGANGGDGGRAGVRIWAQDPSASARQIADTVWGIGTSDATATRMTAYGAASASNVFNISTDARAFAMNITIIAEQANAQNIKVWQYSGAILSRQTGAASTLLTLPAAVTTTQGAPGAWAVSITADTTYAGLNVTVTGAAATSIRWTVSIASTEAG